jgi:hypothetical protein
MQPAMLRDIFLGYLSMGKRSVFRQNAIHPIISREYAPIFFAAAMCLAPAISAESARPSGVTSIHQIQQGEPDMALYNVVLDRRLEAGELDGISKRIKKSVPKAKLMLVSFFLRGMTQEREAWATSAFNPSLDSFITRINETTTRTNPPDADLRVAVGQ